MNNIIETDEESRAAAEADALALEAAKAERKKKILLASVAGGAISIAAIGIVMVLMSPTNDPKPLNAPYQNITLDSNGKPQENGTVGINPQQITLGPLPDGTYAGKAIISALLQDFTVGNIEIVGDPNLAIQSKCPAASQILKAGQQCEVAVIWRPGTTPGVAQPAINQPAATTAITSASAPGVTTPAAPPPQIALHIVGASRSPNGASIQIDQYAPISGIPGTAGSVTTIDPITGAVIAANGQPLPPGVAAGQGIDPYGPANPVLPGQGAPGYAGGPLQPGTANGTVDPATGPGTPGTGPGGPPTLSIREQYILARRQSAFNGAQPRYGSQTATASQAGSWEDIKVPSVTSSAQQDMTRVLTMDRVITAVLVRTFDNRSSQQVVAQVDRNVYGAMGRTILIPRGSTIIGNMSSGGERSVVNWTQIIRPDGARFVMKATGGDAMGQAGVPGYTNNRFGKRFGAILLGTLLKSGIAAATNATQTQSTTGNVNGNATTEQNTGAIVTNIVSQDLNQIVAQINAQNSRIQPVTVVPAGTRLTVFPQQDLVMYPVERQTIVRSAYPRPMNAGASAPSLNPNGEH